MSVSFTQPVQKILRRPADQRQRMNVVAVTALYCVHFDTLTTLTIHHDHDRNDDDDSDDDDDDEGSMTTTTNYDNDDDDEL